MQTRLQIILSLILTAFVAAAETELPISNEIRCGLPVYNIDELQMGPLLGSGEEYEVFECNGNLVFKAKKGSAASIKRELLAHAQFMHSIRSCCSESTCSIVSPFLGFVKEPGWPADCPAGILQRRVCGGTLLEMVENGAIGLSEVRDCHKQIKHALLEIQRTTGKSIYDIHAKNIMCEPDGTGFRYFLTDLDPKYSCVMDYDNYSACIGNTFFDLRARATANGAVSDGISAAKQLPKVGAMCSKVATFSARRLSSLSCLSKCITSEAASQLVGGAYLDAAINASYCGVVLKSQGDLKQCREELAEELKLFQEDMENNIEEEKEFLARNPDCDLTLGEWVDVPAYQSFCADADFVMSDEVTCSADDFQGILDETQAIIDDCQKIVAFLKESRRVGPARFRMWYTSDCRVEGAPIQDGISAER